MPTKNKKNATVLSLVGHYLPGFKSGGPLVSIRNICDGLGSDFEFRILTSDRDIGDTTPYPDISQATWNDVGNARARYIAPGEKGLRKICRIISDTEHDLLYLNSFFASWATVYPLLGRRFGMVPKKPVLLAPRGEFSQGALALKSTKKKTYLSAAKAMGLLHDVQWHASSDYEAEDITRTIGPEARIFIASDLPDQPPAVLPDGPRDDDPVLHVAFLSRISPKKNLEYAIDVLATVPTPVQFNIYGPAEDKTYWSKCQAKLEKLPAHVSWQYFGAVSPSDVPTIMRSNDMFFLPTHGENFGHVIAEALSMGTGVLISDQTPWRDMAALGLGDDISLSRPERFVEVIERRANEPVDARLKNRMTAHSIYVKYAQNNDDIKKNLEMFRHAMSIS